MGIGRRQKTTALRALHGSRKRPHHHPQPDPPRGRPLKPNYLSAVASAAWDELAATLEREGRLTTSDGHWLETTAVAFEALQLARVTAQQTPLTYVKAWTDSSGQEHQEHKVNEAHKELRFALEVFRRQLAEGGLTPTARARVKMGDTETASDPFTQFAAGLQAVK